MNLHYVQVPLGRLPLTLFCLSNGTVAIGLSQHPLAPFKDLLDVFPDGVSAHFHTEGFEVSREGTVEQYSYGEQIRYKQQPLLLKWLQQQELESPFPPKEAN